MQLHIYGPAKNTECVKNKLHLFIILRKKIKHLMPVYYIQINILCNTPFYIDLQYSKLLDET